MNLTRRIKTAEYLDALFHEFTLEEMSSLSYREKERPPEDFYEILLDVVGDDTIIDHRLLLAKVLYLEEGDIDGTTDFNDQESTGWG